MIPIFDDTYFCTLYYPPSLNRKLVKFIKFWNIIITLELKIKAYFTQSLYAFDKLRKLSYVKKKPNYNALISDIRVLLLTFEYKWKYQKFMMNYIFKITLLLKKLKYFIIRNTDKQLI